MARYLLAAASAAMLFSGVSAVPVFRTQNYNKDADLNTCADADMTTSFDVVTGVCSAQKTKYFCNDVNSYMVSYDDADCTDAKIKSVTQLFNKVCGFSLRNQNYQCINSTQSPPAFPFTSFPPASYAVQVRYVNTTDKNLATASTTCAAGTNITAIMSASTNNCVARTSGTTTGYTQNFCTADLTLGGQATFTDSACSSAVISATLGPLTCNNGVQQSCTGRGTFPTSLPKSGMYTYDSKDITCGGQFTSLTLMGETCVDQTKVQCLAMSNGTYIDVYTFSNVGTGAGTCPGTPLKEDINKVDTCIPTGPVDAPTASKKYTCSYAPAPAPGPQPGAASTVSVSVAAILAVAVAALFSL